MQLKEEVVFYEAIYKSEVERREKLFSRMSLPIALLTPILGLWAYMLNKFNLNGQVVAGLIFLALMISSLIIALLIIFFLAKALYGFTDKLLPPSVELIKYHNLLQKTYENYEQADAIIDDFFMKFLRDSYIDYSSQNSDNNDERTKYIVRALISITMMIFISFLGFCFFELCFFASTSDNINLCRFIAQII